jgi:integrase
MPLLRDLTDRFILEFRRELLTAHGTPPAASIIASEVSTILGEVQFDVAEIFERAEDSRAEEIRSIDSWTHNEASRLLEITREKESRWYPLVLTLLHTGCRRGEALGMQWSDVDFNRKRITIRRARVNSRTVLPKHRRRRDKPRTVVITPAMEMALRGLQTFRYRRSGGWVFASRNGTPVEETTTYRAWVRICGHLAEKNIRTLTMHSLRHTFATLSLEAGRSVKWVSQQLGHRDASLTLNTYAHALPDEETDLSFLPVASAGADPRCTGASTKLRSVENRVSG